MPSWFGTTPDRPAEPPAVQGIHGGRRPANCRGRALRRIVPRSRTLQGRQRRPDPSYSCQSITVWPHPLGHRVGDTVGIMAVRDQRGEPFGQAQLLVGTGQQDDTAIRTCRSCIGPIGDRLAAVIWQGEWQRRVVAGEHGSFCPGVQSGFNARFLCDS